MIVYSLNEILNGKESQLQMGFDIEKKVIHLGLGSYGSLSEEDALNTAARFVYHTNALEGSQLKFKDVLGIIAANPVLEGSFQDLTEALTMYDCFLKLRERCVDLSVQGVATVHTDIFGKTLDSAGRIRSGNEQVVVSGPGGVYSRGAPSNEIIPLLEELASWYGQSSSYGPLVRAAVVHNQLLHIHPFKDGNGRVARAFLAQIMDAWKLPVPIVRAEHRMPYYAAIQEFQQNHNLEPMLRFMLASFYSQNVEQLLTPLVQRGLKTIE